MGKIEEEYSPSPTDVFRLIALHTRARLRTVDWKEEGRFFGADPDHEFLVRSPSRMENGSAVGYTELPINAFWGNFMVHGPHLLFPIVEVANCLGIGYERVCRVSNVHFRRPVQKELVITASFEKRFSEEDLVRAELETSEKKTIFVTGIESERPLCGGEYSTMERRKKLLNIDPQIDVGNKSARFIFEVDISLGYGETAYLSGFSYLLAIDLVMSAVKILSRKKVIPALLWLGIGAKNINNFFRMDLVRGATLTLQWRLAKKNTQFDFFDVPFVIKKPSGEEIVSGELSMARPTSLASALNYLQTLNTTNLVGGPIF